MKKVIVTGANGFVGSALCKELSKQGIQVIAIVRNEQSDITQIKGLDNLRILFCELSNFKNLSDLIADRDIDALYHLAWMGSAGFQRGEVNVQLKNIEYTCDTVKACKDIMCRKFIFASSVMEYEVEALMASERVPSITTLYSSAKVSANYMARTLAGSLGITYLRTVISNIYGPGEISPRLINASLRKLLSAEHCSFSSGEQMYDFIYLTDAAKAFVAVGRNGVSNRTYYIGSESPKPLKEYLIEMKNQVNPDIEIGLGEVPFEGVSLTYDEFDIHSVRNDTGFIPEVSFAEGIRKTINWIKGGGLIV